MAEYLNIPSGKSEIVDGFSFLGLENFNSLITDVKFEEWGQTVLIHFIDDLILLKSTDYLLKPLTYV